MRVVADTNVLVSALMRIGTPPARLFDACLDGLFELVFTPDTLQELRLVLVRPHIAKVLRFSPRRVLAIIQQIEQTAIVVTPAKKLNVIKKDPSDNRVIEAAVFGGAKYVISGDKAILELGDAGYHGIRFVSPAEFEDIFLDDKYGLTSGKRAA